MMQLLQYLILCVVKRSASVRNTKACNRVKTKIQPSEHSKYVVKHWEHPNQNRPQNPPTRPKQKRKATDRRKNQQQQNKAPELAETQTRTPAQSEKLPSQIQN